MSARAEPLITQVLPSQVFYNGAGTNYLVQTPAGVYYFVYINQNGTVGYKKSLDLGLTWSEQIVAVNVTASALSVWYDRWSAIAAGLIHIAVTESATDDTVYRTIDTESSDALSTQTVLFAGATTTTGGCLSITRARGGNVYCYTVIDNGVEGGFFRLPNANVPNGAWDAARANPEALGAGDMYALAPGFAADNQDILAIFVDASANQINRYVYDDSANSWAKTLIAAMTETAATASYPHFTLTVDHTNSKLWVLFWSAVDTATADLKLYSIHETSIGIGSFGSGTPVENSGDDQGLCAISIDVQADYKHVFYAGKTDGSETFPTSVNIYSNIQRGLSNQDWEHEQLITAEPAHYRWMASCPITYVGAPAIALLKDTPSGNNDDVTINIALPRRRAQQRMFGG
jgi:hypothetical protein